MQSLRDILRGNLRQSLQALTPLDRLGAAWPVAAGHAIAERSQIVELRGTQAVAEVRDAAWMSELRAMTPRLLADLARVSGVALTDILFCDGRKSAHATGMMNDISNPETDPNAAPPAPAHAAAGAVTLADVRHVAALASLQLTAEEEPMMQRDLNAILAHVAELNALDTAGAPAMAQVGQLLEIAAAPGGGDLRADAQQDSVDRKAVMAEAPETDGRFFKVPKVIER